MLTIEEIKKIIPHRHPFLLVDRIDEYEPGQFAIGRKCVIPGGFLCGAFSDRAGDAGCADH